MIDDYEEPDIERIAAEILDGIVGDDQIGVKLIDSADEFFREYVETGGNLPQISDLDYILLRRTGGYLDQSTWTDIANLDVMVFTKTRSRGQKIMGEVTKRLLRAELNGFLGFHVDFVQVLNGPNPDGPQTMDDNVIEKAFEIHVRVKWL